MTTLSKARQGDQLGPVLLLLLADIRAHSTREDTDSARCSSFSGVTIIVKISIVKARSFVTVCSASQLKTKHNLVLFQNVRPLS